MSDEEINHHLIAGTGITISISTAILGYFSFADLRDLNIIINFIIILIGMSNYFQSK